MSSEKHLDTLPAVPANTLDIERGVDDDLKADHHTDVTEVDGAHRIFQEAQYDTFTPEESKAIRRKLDWRILPLRETPCPVLYVADASLPGLRHLLRR